MCSPLLFLLTDLSTCKKSLVKFVDIAATKSNGNKILQHGKQVISIHVPHVVIIYPVCLSAKA